MIPAEAYYAVVDISNQKRSLQVVCETATKQESLDYIKAKRLDEQDCSVYTHTIKGQDGKTYQVICRQVSIVGELQ